jgi:MoaA/NifB/PqqE/SkfB family radical SAM enzyme
MQRDATVRQITDSPYYPRRMMTQFAESTVQDWVNDPEYAGSILRGETVAARNLEVHATRGTCDYTCTMCLWSDKEELTYRNLGLGEFGLMDASDWGRVFQSAQDLGTSRVVFSGGGEPLLNKDLFNLSATARGMGLKTHLYTNGFGLRRATEKDWGEVVQMEQVRFSMHSPTEDVYNQIVTMPEGVSALPTVAANIRELLVRRNASGGNVNVGIGFVTQTLNHHQIEEMVDFAKDLGVDFINLRQDEVEVTRELGNAERRLIAAQLSSIRDRNARDEFGGMHVDMSDDLVALANGVEQNTRRVATCFAKILRPAISPFGVVAPCDLRAEPRFSDPDYVLGNVKRQQLPVIMENAAQKDIDASCEQCMPSGRTINAIVTKLIKDFEAGIDYTDQPFARVN